MKKKIDKRRDLEKKLLLKTQTLRRLDLTVATGGDGACTEPASCGPRTCGCTGTYEAFG